jgi:hypothetical protein
VTFRLRRESPASAELELAGEHAQVVSPRRGAIAWDAFDRAAFEPTPLAEAASVWRERARQEYASLALFTQLASQVHLLGAPLDWSGALARMIADEVRHTELCARFAEALEPGGAIVLDETGLHLPVAAATLRAHVRGTVLAALCIGETISGRIFRECLRAATVPLARDVVRTIVDDETFHGRVGWELLALLMRGEGDATFEAERDALAAGLADLFAHYRGVCGAGHDEAWTREPDRAPEAPNFGTLTERRYARCFWDGMRDDVVPALVECGLPEASAAWATASARAPGPPSPAHHRERPLPR